MSLAVKKIDNILTEQVGNGSCPSVAEAEQELISVLAQRDIDRGIAQGRVDIKNGDFREMTLESNAQFIDNLAKKILPKTSK